MRTNLPLVAIIDSRRGNYLEVPDIEQRELAGQAHVQLLRVESADELRGRLNEVDLVICWHHIEMKAELIAEMSCCRGIVRAAVGYDNIDLLATAERRIPVCNVPDYGSEEVADHSWALLLALLRKIPILDRHCREGGWEWQSIGSTRRLRGERLGLVGFGRIGSAVARRAHAFGIEVGFYDPYVCSGTEKAHGVRRYEDLNEMIAASKLLSIHVNLSERSEGLIGREQFALMSPDTVLINTSRGDVIDQAAMLESLERGIPGALGLDVLRGEPQVPEVLRTDDRVLLTAHAAFYSDDALTELRIKSAQTALNLILARPDRNVVNGVELSPPQNNQRKYSTTQEEKLCQSLATQLP